MELARSSELPACAVIGSVVRVPLTDLHTHGVSDGCLTAHATLPSLPSQDPCWLPTALRVRHAVLAPTTLHFLDPL